jgi:hypothetical protein
MHQSKEFVKFSLKKLFHDTTASGTAIKAISPIAAYL